MRCVVWVLGRCVVGVCGVGRGGVLATYDGLGVSVFFVMYGKYNRYPLSSMF